eukprot:XP_020400881.1 spidroin-1-like [Zea mays]
MVPDGRSGCGSVAWVGDVHSGFGDCAADADGRIRGTAAAGASAAAVGARAGAGGGGRARRGPGTAEAAATAARSGGAALRASGAGRGGGSHGGGRVGRGGLARVGGGVGWARERRLGLRERRRRPGAGSAGRGRGGRRAGDRETLRKPTGDLLSGRAPATSGAPAQASSSLFLKEAATHIQLWLLGALISHSEFDVVDFLICEIEDMLIWPPQFQGTLEASRLFFGSYRPAPEDPLPAPDPMTDTQALTQQQTLMASEQARLASEQARQAAEQAR